MRALVTARRDITEELWIVRVRPEQPFHFKAGQYVAVGLPENGRVVERPYSIASAPGDAELEFFLELVRKGELTPHLYNVPVGSEVQLRQEAKGLFAFDRVSGRRNHFLAATVTGVAPFMSMIRDLVRAGVSDHRVALLHAASFSVELAYCDELSGYARAHAWFTYIPTVSRPWLDPGWSGEVGRAEDIARKHLDSLGFTPDNATTYLCGNPHMIANLKEILVRARFPRQGIRQELYWVE